jgi:N-acetyl-gamma-glutamyl-phosphate reductase
MGERISIGIVGASGYGGVQLVRLLQDHPAVEIAYLGGNSSAGKTMGDIYPHLSRAANLPIEPIDPAEIARRCQVVFLSLPNGIACNLAPKLLALGCQVLDLSADYRFSNLDTGIKSIAKIKKPLLRRSMVCRKSIAPSCKMPSS